MPTLFIFAGLPGTGKTTLSQRLAQQFHAAHLRIDTIEQAMRDLFNLEIEGEGYRLAYRVAADNLRLGLDVIADSCNPLQTTRREWEEVATTADADFVNIEVMCSDVEEHRHRIEKRRSNIDGLVLPDWQAVTDREYHIWSRDRVTIDTANRSIDDSFAILMHSCRLHGISMTE